MKKLVLALYALVAANLFADGEPVAGQKTIRSPLVTWSATGGTYAGKTRLLFLGNNVYVDTSSTGQAGQFKRVDNGADSCSNAVPIVADTNGATRPVWEYRLWETVRSVDKDSSTHIYRVQTRERVYDGTSKTVRWTPWTRSGSNTGYTDISIQDSIVVPNVGVTSKTSQYALASFLGSWARLCPDDIAATANAATDSVFADSLILYVR